MSTKVVNNGCCQPRSSTAGMKGTVVCVGSYGDACDECQTRIRLVPEGAIVDREIGVLVVDAPDDDVHGVMLGVQALGARGVLRALREVAPSAIAETPMTLLVAMHQPPERLMPAITATNQQARELEIAHNESWSRQSNPTRWSINERIVIVPRSVGQQTLNDGSTLLTHPGRFPGRVMHYNSLLVCLSSVESSPPAK
jgi:hypothetical protein